MSDKIKKFSQAIRLGALQSAKATRCFVDADGSTCAIGAALLAAGMFVNENAHFDFGFGNASYGEIVEFLQKRFTLPLMASHPVTGTRYDLVAVIVNLNDLRGWSRERIADWLESIGC